FGGGHPEGTRGRWSPKIFFSAHLWRLCRHRWAEIGVFWRAKPSKPPNRVTPKAIQSPFRIELNLQFAILHRKCYLMYRYFLAFSGLIAILLLPACGSTQIGGAASSSGTPVSAAPTSGAAPGAAPPTSAPGAATAAPTIGQPAPAIKLKQVAGE